MSQTNLEPGLDVLNTGAGHLTFRFDKEGGAEELSKAKAVVTDMLRRGYMLFILVDGEQKRVRKFDAQHGEYIIEEPEPTILKAVEAADSTAKGVQALKKRGRPRKVPMTTTRATGIGRSAGG